MTCAHASLRPSVAGFACGDCRETFPIEAAATSRLLHAMFSALAEGIASAERRTEALEQIVADKLHVEPCEKCGGWFDTRHAADGACFPDRYLCAECVLEVVFHDEDDELGNPEAETWPAVVAWLARASTSAKRHDRLPLLLKTHPEIGAAVLERRRSMAR